MEQWAAARGGLPFFDVSAKDDIFVEEAFVAATRLALQNKQAARADAGAPPAVNLQTAPAAGGASTSSCCS